MSLLLKIKSKLKRISIVYYILSPISRLYYYVFFFYIRNKKFKQKGELILFKAKSALDSIGIHYWLDFGTLLGIYRDNSLLPNDLDIDLGVFLKDYSSEIEKAMKTYGFKLKKEYSIDNKNYGLEQTYELDGVTVDLFYYSYDEQKMWSHVFVNFPGITFKDSIKIKGGLLPIEQYFPKVGFSKLHFKHHNFTIPHPPHEYLSYHYGDDYLTPRFWNYTDLENDNKNAIYLYEKIGIYTNYMN